MHMVRRIQISRFEQRKQEIEEESTGTARSSYHKFIFLKCANIKI